MSFNFDWNFISSGAPYVTISDTGLGFNTPAITMLGTPDYIQAGFDNEAMVIGIRGCEESSSIKTYRFKERIKDGWVRIGCRDFVKYLSDLLGLSFSPAKRYVAKYDSAEDVLYVELNAKESQSENKEVTEP